MNRRQSSHQSLLAHCAQAMRVLQAESDDATPKDYQSITSLLQNIDFFSRNLRPAAKLHDFTHEAKSHIKYEIHEYGTVLLKENDHSDKLYIILSGDVQKLCQRSAHEIQQDRNKNASNSPRPDANQGKRLTVSYRSSFSRCERNKKVQVPQISCFKDSLKLFNKSIFSTEVPAKSLSLSKRERSDSNDNSPLSRRDSLQTFTAQSSPRNSKICSSQYPLSKYAIANAFSGGLPKIPIGLISGSEDESPRSSDSRSNSKSSRRRSSGRLSFRAKLNLELITHIVSQYPELAHRCFVDDVVRIESKKTLSTGNYFGETFCQQQVKENSMFAVSSEEAHLLTITRSSYEEILTLLEKHDEEKCIDMSRILGNVNEEELRRFVQYFGTKSYTKGEVIYRQDEKPENFYLVQTGQVSLLKDVQDPNTPNLSNSMIRTAVSTILIEQNKFFGEEVLAKEVSRQYTAIASSDEVTVYFLDTKSYKKISENFPGLCDTLHNHNKAEVLVRFEKCRLKTNKSQKTLFRLSSIPVQADTNSTLPSSNNESLRHDCVTADKKSPHGEIIIANQSIVCIRRQLSLDVSSFLNNDVQDNNTNLKIYKNRFSRKISTSSKLNQMTNDIQSPLSPNTSCLECHRNSSVEFNVAKELGQILPKKISTPKNLSSPISSAYSNWKLPNLTPSTKSKFIDSPIKVFSSTIASGDRIRSLTQRNK